MLSTYYWYTFVFLAKRMLRWREINFQKDKISTFATKKAVSSAYEIER
jgi:hypothetical protein